MSQELKPCPWDSELDHMRGEKHELHIVGGDIYFATDPQCVECSCGAQGPTDYSQNGAIAAWNTRATPNPQAHKEQ